MREKEYDVLVIGDANVDLILRGADLTPDFGQAEKLIEGADMELGVDPRRFSLAGQAG